MIRYGLKRAAIAAVFSFLLSNLFIFSPCRAHEEASASDETGSFQKTEVAPSDPGFLAFPEGRVDANHFYEFLTVCNIDKRGPRLLTVRYIFAEGDYLQKEYIIPSQTRYTIYVNGEVGDNPPKDVSLGVWITAGLLDPERVVYFRDYMGWCSGAHVAKGYNNGTNWGGTDFLLAEGYTGPGFDEWLLVANYESDEDVNVYFEFQIEELETPVVKGPFTVPANSRRTWLVNDLLGRNYQHSTRMWCYPFNGHTFVERAMYFNYMGGKVVGGTVNTYGALTYPGAWNPNSKKPAKFIEGCTHKINGLDFDTWITLQNYYDTPLEIEVEFCLDKTKFNEENVIVPFTIPPKRRKTINAADYVGYNKEFFTEIRSKANDGNPYGFFYAESPIYARYPMWTGKEWVTVTDGAVSFARTYTYWDCDFSEGCTRPGFDTWLLFANPETFEMDFELKFYTEEGQVMFTDPQTGKQTEKYKVIVPPRSRKTIKINDIPEIGYGHDVSIWGPHNYYLERAMYCWFRVDGGKPIPGYTRSI